MNASCKQNLFGFTHKTKTSLKFFGGILRYVVATAFLIESKIEKKRKTMIRSGFDFVFYLAYFFYFIPLSVSSFC